MRKLISLKKILTWAIMSIVGITVAPAVILGGDLPVAAYKADTYYQAHKRSTHRQLACLARNVYYEAGSEPFAGQLAVAQVTVNRARSSSYPDDICAVVSQSRMVKDQKVCQFSWYCDPTRNKRLVVSKNHPSYIAARRVLLEGKRVSKITKDTYFFHRYDIKVDPSWPRKVVAKIGDHVFYKRH